MILIYAESFRHFVQEWIEVQHPKDLSNWPWDNNSALYLINLYPVSGSDSFTKLPEPFISILINGLESEKFQFVTPSDSLYKNWFSQGSFTLPRKYLYDPLNSGVKNMRLSRYSFTSDGYGELASNWDMADLRLIRILGERIHCRYSIYNNDLYQKIRERLNRLEDASGAHVRCAENLLDCTTYVQDGKVPYIEPEMMLIQAPIIGIMKPIKKSKEYKIINGAFVLCDDVRFSIPEEPCHMQYKKALVPFQDIKMQKVMMGQPDRCRAVAYIAAVCRQGVFNFQEYSPSDTVTTWRGQSYVRLLNHQFLVRPELSKTSTEVRLTHLITEGLVPDIRSNRRFFVKSSEKLFYRSDMPTGYIKNAKGEVSIDLPKPQ